MNFKHQLSPEIQNAICAFIRAGGFAHVAAQSAGIPKEVFDYWMSEGAKIGKKRASKYRPFYLAVEEAKAQARLTAEMAVFKDDPKTWLTRGPGKDRPDAA